MEGIDSKGFKVYLEFARFLKEMVPDEPFNSFLGTK